MLEDVKQQVWEANLLLQKYALVTLTWGNVSQIDRPSGLVVIKPSGLPYHRMTPEDMVVTDLAGNRVEGKWNPSSDLATHLELYRRYSQIGGITHTHSPWATVFAQAGQAVPALGTTHADTFYGSVPCTRPLTQEEIQGAYEENTGKVICETLDQADPMAVPGILVASHGPFTWGTSALKSVENAVVLENVAMMAWHTLSLNPQASLPQALADKHYFRKHGPNAYYGQKG